ncbi:MAG: hypothetical protein V2I26_05455 [Halieaceae bacterium]|jgi:hypothetical protein|nr:hypothetical protein [Halieaceae bacterium]
MATPDSSRGIYEFFCRLIKGQGIAGLTPAWSLLGGILTPIWRVLAYLVGFLWRPLSSLFNWLWMRIVPVIWLCAYVMAAALAVALVFVGNDQGQDLLRIAAEEEHLWWRTSPSCSAQSCSG